MIKNNGFAKDTDDSRLERLILLSANIDTYAGELGIADARLAWAQGASAEWQSAVANATVEDGQMDEAFQEFHQKIDEVYHYFTQAREYLTSLIWEIEKPDDLLKAYGFEGETPRTGEGLINAINAWKTQHEIMVAAGKTPVVNDTIMNRLVAYRDELIAFRTTARTEETESDAAYRAKQELFDADSKRLAILFAVAKLTWGNDDERLKMLGFCPSSEIWTQNKPPYPKNFAYDENSGQFTWDAVEGVDNYEIDYRLTGASGDWTQLYKGAATSTANKPPEPGEYDFRIRSWAGDDYGSWSGVISVNFPEGALDAPKNLAFDPKSKKLSWEIVPNADRYEVEVRDENGVVAFSGETEKDNIKLENLSEQVEYTAKVRAVKDGSPQEYSPWSDGIAVWLGLPLVPQNLRWSEAEYHGDTFALIEWDAAFGADTYELEFDPAGGDAEIFDVGANLYKYEDIMHTPRTYKYRVRGKNIVGVGDWSATLTIEIA